MKRIFLSLYLVCSLGLACAHVQPVAVDCSKDVSAEILPSVESALATGDYEAELAKLVGKWGECVIRKGVELVTKESRADSRFADGDTLSRIKAQHGEAWLAAHPAH